jgi:hypothetical protein
VKNNIMRAIVIAAALGFLLFPCGVVRASGWDVEELMLSYRETQEFANASFPVSLHMYKRVYDTEKVYHEIPLSAALVGTLYPVPVGPSTRQRNLATGKLEEFHFVIRIRLICPMATLSKIDGRPGDLFREYVGGDPIHWVSAANEADGGCWEMDYNLSEAHPDLRLMTFVLKYKGIKTKETFQFLVLHLTFGKKGDATQAMAVQLPFAPYSRAVNGQALDAWSRDYRSYVANNGGSLTMQDIDHPDGEVVAEVNSTVANLSIPKGAVQIAAPDISSVNTTPPGLETDPVQQVEGPYTVTPNVTVTHNGKTFQAFSVQVDEGGQPVTVTRIPLAGTAKSSSIKVPAGKTAIVPQPYPCQFDLSYKVDGHIHHDRLRMDGTPVSPAAVKE